MFADEFDSFILINAVFITVFKSSDFFLKLRKSQNKLWMLSESFAVMRAKGWGYIKPCKEIKMWSYAINIWFIKLNICIFKFNKCISSSSGISVLLIMGNLSVFVIFLK